MGKQNDQRADVKNPNNPAHKDDRDNRSNQKNPNHPPSKGNENDGNKQEPKKGK